MADKLKILFLHPNFPGQFRNLAIVLGSKKYYDVRFLCMTDFGNHINGIHKIIIKGERGQAAMEEQARSEEAKMNFRSESYRRAFKTFKNQNWNPSIVIGHTGWGCGIYVKEVWLKQNSLGTLNGGLKQTLK